jgi:hypothetical protein
VGFRGKAPGQGVKGEAPLKLRTFSHLKNILNEENCTIFGIFYTSNNATICAETLLIYNLDDSDDRACHLSISMLTFVKLRYLIV